MGEVLVAVFLLLFLAAMVTSPPEPKVKRVDPHTIVVSHGDKTTIYKEVK